MSVRIASADTSTTLNQPPVAHLNARDLVRAPHLYMLELTRTYGDIVQYRATLDFAYLINHPDYVQQVLLTNAHNYNKDTFLNKYLLVAITGQGLLTSEPPLWRIQRRLIQPAFHRRSLVKFENVMVRETLATVADWQAHAKSGQMIDIASEMMKLTLRIISECLFSYDISAQVDEIRENLDVMVTIGKPKHRKVQDALAFMNRVVYGIIDQRRQRPDDERDDLLNMLLTARYDDGTGMSDQQVRDEVITLLVAGHETTANTLSWLWWLLAQNPHERERLDAELDAVLNSRQISVTDFEELPFTRRVIDEAMRLYPSAWTISRRALADDDLGGYHIPAQAIVAMSPYAMHRHPDYWDDPERFDPDRFLPEHAENRPRFAYFPFGGGARMCIGDSSR